jgi:hypothetical protein
VICSNARPLAVISSFSESNSACNLFMQSCSAGVTRTRMSTVQKSQFDTAFSVSELKRGGGSLTFADFTATLSLLPAVGRRSEVRAFGNRRTLNAMLIVHALPNYESENAGGNAGTDPAR